MACRCRRDDEPDAGRRSIEGRSPVRSTSLGGAPCGSPRPEPLRGTATGAVPGVGGWNTLAGYGAFAILYYFLSGALSYAVIIVMSYAFAIINAYLGYRYVAFRSHGSIMREFPRFSAVYLATMVVNLAVFPLALRALPFGAYVVQALFTVAVVAASYVAHRNFSFRQRSSTDGKSPPARTDPGAGAGLAGLDEPVSGGE